MASTFKAKPVIDPLEREQREIERRRQRFMDRTARILHAKTRIIGVDAEGLKRQQEEKQQREQAEKEREAQFAEMMNRHAQMVTDQVVQMERDKRRQNQEVANYRKDQEMEKRAKDVATRSFDLANNPEAETVMLKFPGEDLGKKDRVKMQQSQQQDWLAQQLGILAEKEERERQEEAEYAAMQAQIVALKKQMEQERDHFRTKRNVETKEANLTMSADRRSRTLQDAAINEARNQEMLKAQLTGDFLNEAVPQSAFGAHRIVPYAFKGMTVEQKQKILDEQARQLAEAKAARDKAEQEERQYAQQQEEIRRALVKAQREKAVQERQARLNLLQDQQVQKREKDERTQHLDRAVYQNPVDPSYFDQWGKSCR